MILLIFTTIYRHLDTGERVSGCCFSSESNEAYSTLQAFDKDVGRILNIGARHFEDTFPSEKGGIF